MKKYLYLIITLFTVLGCKKSELLTFEGENVILFGVDENLKTTKGVDSVMLNFTKLEDSVKTLTFKIPVFLLGAQKDSEFRYNISVNKKESTAIQGTDFIVPDHSSFKPNQSTDSVELKVIRSKALATGQIKIVLELDSTSKTSSRHPLIGDKSLSHKLIIYSTDYIVPPPHWNTLYFGKFSAKKLRLMVKLDNYWSFEDMYGYSHYYPDYFGEMLYNYLKQQKDAGTPVLEADGSPMEWGAFFK